MMNQKLLATALAVVCANLLSSAAAEAKAPSTTQNPFFAFCMDTHDAKKRTLEQQAELLKELGYDGAGHLWLDKVPERLQTLDAAGLKLFQVCFQLNVAADAKQPYDPKLKEVIALLKGRGTMLAALVSGGKASDETRDERAVELLREIGELAAKSGLQVVLYPHAGDWLERVEDAIRVTEKVNRPNVGTMFNLCHWLRVDKQRDYRSLLQRASPKLFAVSINGADALDEQSRWSKYIQPLGRGTFDVCGFLKTLRQLGYTGPVGLQCYGIPGDVRDPLAESMKAWRDYSARLAGEK